jgi:hypothetical protein
LGAADPVRIRRSEIGERLAQRGILQAQGVGILAKGEIPEKRTVEDACPYSTANG